MNNIELLILVSGIVLSAIINFYFCCYKEEQRNNKIIECNKIIERNEILSLCNEIYRLIFELMKMKILENKTIERNKIISLCNEIYGLKFELNKIIDNKMNSLDEKIKQRPVLSYDKQKLSYDEIKLESEISSELSQINQLLDFVKDIDKLLKISY